MQIAICDDESSFRIYLKEKIVDYKKSKRVAVDIYEFESGSDLLNCDVVFDVVFIDYQMPGINGLETAHYLRKSNCICSIIFVTNYPQFMIDAFEVQTFRFLIKPLDNSKLVKALDDYIEQQSVFNPIVVVNNGEQKTISSQSIVYLEGDGRNSIIRTTTNTYHSSKSISYLQNLLPEHCFFRIHRSYLVNLYCIKLVKGNEVVLTNGEKANIGRNHCAEFKRVYRNFVKDYYVRL